MQRVPTYRPSLEEALGGKPTEAEQKVLAAAKAGRMESLRTDGSRPEEADDDTRIRAALIRFLMLGGDKEHPVHPRGVMIRSAFITGKLDLRACETQLDLSLHACCFDATARLSDSHLGGLYLPGCEVPGLRAHRMILEENLHLRAIEADGRPTISFKATKCIDIAGAHIRGHFDCSGGHFDGGDGKAINGDALTVNGEAFLRRGFRSKGEVNLRGSRIAGQLSCIGASLDGAGGLALYGNAIEIGASVFMSRGFNSIGTVNLSRATIGGQLSFVGGKLNGSKEKAFIGDAMVVKESLIMSAGFEAKGDVNLVGTKIAGRFHLKQSNLEGGLNLPVPSRMIT